MKLTLTNMLKLQVIEKELRTQKGWFTKTTSIVLGVIALIATYISWNNPKYIAEREGSISPNDIPYESKCGLDNSYKFVIGSNEVELPDGYAKNILTFEDKVILSAENTNEGLLVSGKFYKKNGKDLIEFSDNVYKISSGAHADLSTTKSDHELKLTASDGSYLNFEFLNEKTMRLTGHFFLPENEYYDEVKIGLYDPERLISQFDVEDALKLIDVQMLILMNKGIESEIKVGNCSQVLLP